MRSARAALTTLVVVGLTVVASGQRAPGDDRQVAGQWRLTLTMELGTATPEITISQDGDRITGTYKGRYGEFPITGRIRGRTIHFEFKMRSADQPAEMCFEGEIAADSTTMTGTANMADLGDATWTAAKTKARN